MSRAKGDTTVEMISGQIIDRCHKFEYYMKYNDEPKIVCHNEVLYVNVMNGNVISKLGDYRIVKSWEDIQADEDKSVFKNKIPDVVDRWSQETSGSRNF